MLKLKCPVCKDNVDVDEHQYDEGDFVKCEECSELLTLEVRKGQFTLVTDQEKKYEEMEDLDDELDYEEEE